ncbi:MAG TPA: sigma 54-interacting transcriptional regulator [Polyangiaceae bacterium]|jgi:DNA-binding NtrC family response regulator|nr:sigma 54-interacting transcriptional regulator [Polyangiaceae bacterium]
MGNTRTSPQYSTHNHGDRGLRGLLWVHPELRLDPLPEGTILIGRGSDARIRLSGDQVSRRHATLRVTKTSIVLRDEGSLNKARCNQVALPECQLSDNDVLRIGDWVGIVIEGLDDGAFTGDPFATTREGIVVGPRSRGLWETLARVATQPLPIVIEGETGTGKEVIARAIHEHSGRSGRFVPVNCAAQPEGLFESTFFGHTAGAFTGAARAADGLFVAAHGGTLFLDELIELNPAQQAKALRAVEERKVTPVGSTHARAVDVRLVSAAQRGLSLVVDEGRFRADLYARLNGLTLRLQPLRSRREEILPLFVQAMKQEGASAPNLAAGFVEQLCTHPFHLNVRELMVAAKRCNALHGAAPVLTREHLASVLDRSTGVSLNPATPDSDEPEAFDAEAALGKRSAAWLQRNQAKLGRLEKALDESDQNLSEAARKVGISRHQAQRLIQAAARLREGAPLEASDGPQKR